MVDGSLDNILNVDDSISKIQQIIDLQQLKEKTRAIAIKSQPISLHESPKEKSTLVADHESPKEKSTLVADINNLSKRKSTLIQEISSINKPNAMLIKKTSDLEKDILTNIGLCNARSKKRAILSIYLHRLEILLQEVKTLKKELQEELEKKKLTAKLLENSANNSQPPNLKEVNLPPLIHTRRL